MFSYLRKKKKNILFIFFLLLAIVFIQNNKNKKGSDFVLGRVVLSIALPSRNLSNYIKQAFLSFSKRYFVLIDLKKENDRIKRKLEENKLAILNYNSIAVENQNLREAFQFNQKNEDQKKLAEIIGGVSDNYTNYFVINKGKKHGILKNQAVINSSGVIGKILTVQNTTSYVQLITSKKSKIPVILKRTRDRGILQGEGKNLLTLKFISLKSDIQKGDVVVASGLAGIFPKEFPVGTVKNFKENEYYYSLEANIETYVNFSRIEYVFVVLKSLQNESLPLFQEDL